MVADALGRYLVLRADLSQAAALAASRHPRCDGVLRWEGAVAERGPADDLVGDAVLASDLGRGAAAASLLGPRLHPLAVVLVGHGGSAELMGGAGNGPYGLVAVRTALSLTPARHAISAADSPACRRAGQSRAWC